MRQALHIFRKDVRYLWREICLVLALASIFAWTNPWWMAMLLLAAMSYLIARLIHAETIPGDRQFWVTRPYRWTSLLGAKLLFMLAFVNLPILLAQLGIVAAGGFPLSSYLAGLFWSQVLLIISLSLPVAALAAMTPGIVPFVFSMLILVAIWFGTDTAIWFRQGGQAPWPSALEWIRETIALMALTAIVISILYTQYRRRKTLYSRAIALTGITLTAAVYSYLPWTSAWALQTQFSKEPLSSSLLQISSDPATVRFTPVHARTWENVEVRLPVAVSPIPDGAEIRGDALALTFEGPDGAIWKSNLGSVQNRSGGSGVAMLDVSAKMSMSYFNQEREKPVSLRGSLYLTLFGNARAKTIPLQGAPVNALDGVQCYLGVFDQFFCRSAFRWPAKLVYAKFGADISPLTQSVSYSPFPASLRLDPIETRWAPSLPHSAREVTVIVKEPLVHIRRDFELRGVRVTASANAK